MQGCHYIEFLTTIQICCSRYLIIKGTLLTLGLEAKATIFGRLKYDSNAHNVLIIFVWNHQRNWIGREKSFQTHVRFFKNTFINSVRIKVQIT